MTTFVGVGSGISPRFSHKDWSRTPPPPPDPGFRENRISVGVDKPILASAYLENFITGTVDTAVSSTVVNKITALQGVGSTKMALSITGFSPIPYLDDGSFPLTSVALVSGTTGGMVGGTSQKGRMLQEYGIPLSPSFVPLGSSDAPYTVYTPGFTATYNPGTGSVTVNGRLMDVFRLRKAGYTWDSLGAAASGVDPRTVNAPLTGSPYVWECQSALRILDVANSPGYPVDRQTTQGSLSLATWLSITEAAGWSSTATRLPYLPAMVLEEDIRRYEATGYVPRHGYGIAVPEQPGTHRWPAQANDASTHFVSGSPLEEGIRLRLNMGRGETPGLSMPQTDAAIDALGLHPIAAMVAKAVARYGFVIWDSAANLSIRTEMAVYNNYANGTPNIQIFNNFPVANLEVVKAGSAAVPNP